MSTSFLETPKLDTGLIQFSGLVIHLMISSTWLTQLLTSFVSKFLLSKDTTQQALLVWYNTFRKEATFRYVLVNLAKLLNVQSHRYFKFISRTNISHPGHCIMMHKRFFWLDLCPGPGQSRPVNA
ncbi:5eda96f5-61db-4f88-847b-fa7126b34140 [Sclerotinia trifoliorum]|uniref:5eda96f5-61db-4f88-847b-fa7126b34140 n=1 Tax=Sclerotinia trifoliorum TaxID=28548 RepID=A0A8H2ZTM8_9HELO|nr:5eda96f5-61db-4f88-847b-fa7126b34140 [Sclerotinia trifoliorum]